MMLRWLSASSLACIAASVLLLAGCARAPLSTEGVARDLSPGEARANPERARGERIIWGGVIADARNLAERTRLEIVGYPLDENSQRPLTAEAPRARFRVYVDGYVETAAYAPGRRLSVLGTVDGTEQGRIDEASYTFPVVEAQALELWPERRRRERSSGVNFGFGILLGG
jgi:outer membrane lipoprotein